MEFVVCIQRCFTDGVNDLLAAYAWGYVFAYE